MENKVPQCARCITRALILRPRTAAYLAFITLLFHLEVCRVLNRRPHAYGEPPGLSVRSGIAGALAVNKVFDCKTLAVTVYYYAISSNVIPKSPKRKVDNA